MKKYGWIGLLVLAALFLAALWLDPYQLLWGVLKRQHFYRGRPTTYWSRALRSPRPSLQVEAREALRNGGQAAVPVLLELLREDPTDWNAAEVRWTAAEILGQLGSEAQAAVPALVMALHDPDAQVRGVAVAALGSIGQRAE